MKQLDEQRYLWLLRAFIIFLIISIFFNIILFISYGEISPQPKKEVFFVSSGNSGANTFYITNANTNNNLFISQDSVGYEIAKNYISNYVIDRQTIYSDRQKMQNLWGIESNVYYFSSKDIYKNFSQSQEYINGFINKDKKITTVKINNIEYQNKSNKWDVSILLQTTDIDGKYPINTNKTIEIKGVFLKGNISKTGNEKWKNPLDFKITEYKYK